MSNINLQTIIDNPVNIILAVIIVDVVALVLARNGKAGKVINEWYDKFGFGAFVSDIASICFGIFLSLILFKYVFPEKAFTLTNFILSVVLIQFTHDILFSLVIRSYPKNSNKMMDVFKGYVNENGWKILIVDAIMMISSVLLIYLLSKLNKVVIYFLLAFFLYFVQYLIYS